MTTIQPPAAVRDAFDQLALPPSFDIDILLLRVRECTGKVVSIDAGNRLGAATAMLTADESEARISVDPTLSQALSEFSILHEIAHLLLNNFHVDTSLTSMLSGRVALFDEAGPGSTRQAEEDAELLGTLLWNALLRAKRAPRQIGLIFE